MKNPKGLLAFMKITKNFTTTDDLVNVMKKSMTITGEEVQNVRYILFNYFFKHAKF